MYDSQTRISAKTHETKIPRESVYLSHIISDSFGHNHRHGEMQTDSDLWRVHRKRFHPKRNAPRYPNENRTIVEKFRKRGGENRAPVLASARALPVGQHSHLARMCTSLVLPDALCPFGMSFGHSPLGIPHTMPHYIRSLGNPSETRIIPPTHQGSFLLPTRALAVGAVFFRPLAPMRTAKLRTLPKAKQNLTAKLLPSSPYGWLGEQ